MLSFSQFLDEANWSRVNRVRDGKIQRRKMISQRPGYRMQDGKLVRNFKKKKTLTKKKTNCGD